MTDTAATPTPVEDLLARARAYVPHSHAKNTLDAYTTDWKHFSRCDLLPLNSAGFNGSRSRALRVLRPCVA